MPLFMDRHDDAAGLAPEDVAEAHARDVAVQDKYGVRYITYWHDPEADAVFCLADGPDEETVRAVHAEAHGMVAARIIPVDGAAVASFLGRIAEAPVGTPHVETALRTVVFTDVEGSTDLTQRLGDAAAMQALWHHDRVVRTALEKHRGQEVKHTGDGIMASFPAVSSAIQASCDVHRELDGHDEFPIRVRIGLATGEPITQDGDLFGTTVQLAARLCAAADAATTLVPASVTELAAGKGIEFEPRGRVTLRGFAEPVAVFAVPWHQPRA